MNKILITGAAGFIGVKLARELINKKNKIYLLDNLSRGKSDIFFKEILKNKDVHFFKKDLNKKLTFKENFDYIFHLASVVGVKNVNKDPLLKMYQLSDSKRWSCFFLLDQFYRGHLLSRIHDSALEHHLIQEDSMSSHNTKVDILIQDSLKQISLTE